MQVQQTATVALGRDDFSATGRLLRWSTAGATAGALMVLTAMSVLAPGGSAAGNILFVAGWLLLGAGLLGAAVAIRAGREVRMGPGNAVEVHRHLLPSRRYVGVRSIVLHEQIWSLAVPVVVDQFRTDPQGSGHGSYGPEQGAAQLSAVLADGREMPIGEIEWRERRAAADRVGSILGVDVVVERSSAIASCG